MSPSSFPASSPTLLPTKTQGKIKRFQPLYNLTVRFPTQEVSANLHRVMPALPGNVCRRYRLSCWERHQLLPPWHQTYFKQAKMLFSEGMGTHPLHLNWCAKSFESPEPSDKIETSTVANRRRRYWGQSPRWHRCLFLHPIPFVLHLVAWIWGRGLSSVPGRWSLIQHLSSREQTFPAVTMSQLTRTDVDGLVYKEESPRKRGGGGRDMEGRRMLLKEPGFQGPTGAPNSWASLFLTFLPLPALVHLYVVNLLCHMASAVLLPTPSQPFLLPGGSSCVDKPPRII